MVDVKRGEAPVKILAALAAWLASLFAAAKLSQELLLHWRRHGCEGCWCDLRRSALRQISGAAILLKNDCEFQCPGEYWTSLWRNTAKGTKQPHGRNLKPWQTD